MAGFVAPIVQGLSILEEHKKRAAEQAKQAEAAAAQQNFQQLITALYLHKMQGGN